jgi:integrase
LEERECRGHNWKVKRTWKPRTVNRVLAVLAAILERCASEDWKMLPKAPNVPLLAVAKSERKWVKREQAIELLKRFPLHTCDMTIMALATGLRRSNITHLQWERIDMARCCCYVPGYETKAGEPIPVPLNADAMAVLERWKIIHEAMRGLWPADAHRYVFVFRGHAPIQQVTTAMWRRECAAVGLAGVTFHSVRHSWASWQVQGGTSARVLMDMGGWASMQMPNLYTHLDPGHLSQFADRTLIGADKTVTETVTQKLKKKRTRVSACFNGKGGTPKDRDVSHGMA